MNSEGSAAARAALAGNPSDGYGGAVLAVTIDPLQAHVVAAPARELTVEPPSALVGAAARRLGAVASLTWSSGIPRSVGLGGSSAIVIATLRALGELEETELAELALAVEVEDLGIAAGPQDRFAQAYGGLTFMEFGGSRPRCERLDRSLLPPLVVAWREEASEHSGAVHDRLRRAVRREPVARLADAARGARRALLDHDLDSFGRAVDATFDARSDLMALDPDHVEMVTTARACGASANYSGSGGAIVAVCRDGRHRAAVDSALRAIGCSTL